jgi:hypothetical protein
MLYSPCKDGLLYTCAGKSMPNSRTTQRHKRMKITSGQSTIMASCRSLRHFFSRASRNSRQIAVATGQGTAFPICRCIWRGRKTLRHVQRREEMTLEGVLDVP